jgi:ribosomal protein S14
VKSAKETTQLSSKTRPKKTTTRRRCRTASSCGRGSAVLAYLTSLSFRISRLAWRLV